MSYGTWVSPIKSSLIVENTIVPLEIRIDEKGNAYWIEQRPSENGRYAIRSNRDQNDLIPQPFNGRTRVHEYGGGAYIVYNDTVFFTNFADQRIYKVNIQDSSTPTAITPESKGASLRYADFVMDSTRQKLICVHESHENESDVQNSIVALSLDGSSSLITLDSGYDFYSSPRISPDGKYLIWICWNHPNMPWDQTELWIGEFSGESNVTLINKRKLFGQKDESIVQPQWSSDGKFIYFVSDISGWWNIYRTALNEQSSENLCNNMEAEFSGPAWQFGTSYYGFDGNGNIICAYWKDGLAKLVSIDVQTKTINPLSGTEDYTDVRYVRVHNQTVYFIGSSATKPTEIVAYNYQTNQKEIYGRSSGVKLDERYLSVPEMIKFKTGNDFAYGIYYPPKNDDYPISSDTTELPPLLVRNHGGPTSATTSAFSLRIQYWTSRGFAFLDVNYRGSTGYGRKFRDSLKYNWGVYDVQDVIAGAQHLVEQNKVDRNRLAIDGGSAGGYTTLCALTMANYFSAGASLYGVSNLELLALDTHKFESRYLDQLIGAYPAQRDIYIERSPITHVKNASKPIIFFQGSEDKVVPPNQAEIMVDALREKRVPVAYVLFEGEQHGFRKAENIQRSLDGEFYFFSKIFGFEMADKIEPIPIENFPTA